MKSNSLLIFCFLTFCFVHISTGLAAKDNPPPNSNNPASTAAPFIPDGARNQNPSESSFEGQTLRIKRSLLMVSDMKRSLYFYQNVLGLEVYSVDQDYSYDDTNIGKRIFNTAEGTRRRFASLNTSDEVRGLSLREIDTEFEVPQSPRLSAILFEASDILEIYERAIAAGGEVIAPNLAIVPARGDLPELRFMELAIIDPDGHVIAFFKYYGDTEEDRSEWSDATKKYQVDIAP